MNVELNLMVCPAIMQANGDFASSAAESMCIQISMCKSYVSILKHNTHEARM
jgi:hypothetical protein